MFVYTEFRVCLLSYQRDIGVRPAPKGCPYAANTLLRVHPEFSGGPKDWPLKARRLCKENIRYISNK